MLPELRAVNKLSETGFARPYHADIPLRACIKVCFNGYCE